MRFQLLLLSLLFTVTAYGEPVTVRKVFGTASAAPNTTLESGNSFSTGPNSRSEMGSARATFRIGEKASLEVLPHGVSIKKGVTLIASGPGGLRKTVEVKSPGHRLQICGTAQVAYDPGHSLRVVVLEGEATLSFDAFMGEFETITAGQMLIVNPTDRRLPDPVDIDIQRLVATSSLVSGDFGPLATAAKIGAATIRQSLGYQRGRLVDTTLELQGLDNAVLVQRSALSSPVAARQQSPNEAERVQQVHNGINDLAAPSAVTKVRSYVFTDNTGKTARVADTTFARNDQNPGRTNVLTVELAPHRTARTGLPPLTDQAPLIEGTVTVDPDIFSGAVKTLRFLAITRAPGFDRLNVSKANVCTPKGVGLDFDVNLGVDFDLASVTAGNGLLTAEPLSIKSAADGVNVQNGSNLRGGQVTIVGGEKAGTIFVDRSRITSNQNLRIGQDTSPTGIVVRNSSDLRSLAADVVLLTNRAPISIESAAKLSAKKKLILDASGKVDPLNPSAASGVVTIRDAQVTANAIRIRGYGASGDSLVVDGASLSGTQLIELFAEGASTLRFRNSVNLATKLAVLAGKKVAVDAGGAVVISGRGQIFTDAAEYNKPGFGTIHANGGLSEKPFDRH